MPRRPNAFRIRAVHLFLTYPQCALKKEYVFDILQKRYNPIRVLVAEESHQDGSPHIHAYLELPVMLDVMDPSFFDIDGHHGNYQAARSPRKTIEYCLKGQNFKANFHVTKDGATKGSQRREIATKLLEKRSLEELICQEYPELLFGYTRLKTDYDYFQEVQRVRALPKSFTFLPNPWGLVLRGDCTNKRRHFWIYSTVPNLGKTTGFAQPLLETTRASITAGISQYWNVYPDTSIVILDDYNSASLKWSELNQMADGTYGYRCFMRGVLVLNKPLIIVLSNLSVVDLYPYRNDTLYARFKEICVDKFKL
ncbi:replication-associated protein [Capybara virus 18_cap1_371]|nr:replication-associated protein [Capybara virus 18_cap1_371]